MIKSKASVLSILAAACVSVGLLPADALARGSSSGGSTERRSGELSQRCKRATALQQKQVAAAAKQMRRQACSVKSDLHDLLESLEGELTSAGLNAMTDQELAALVDSVHGQIDGFVAGAQAKVMELKDAAALKLSEKGAQPAMFAKLEQAAANAGKQAESMGERAADKFDRLLAELMASDDDDSDDSDDDDCPNSSGGGSSSGGSGSGGSSGDDPNPAD